MSIVKGIKGLAITAGPMCLITALIMTEMCLSDCKIVRVLINNMESSSF